MIGGKAHGVWLIFSLLSVIVFTLAQPLFADEDRAGDFEWWRFRRLPYKCGTFDPNRNGLAYEISDVVLYRDCLLIGEQAFPPQTMDSILMRSDWDCSRMHFEVTTLMYAIRVLVGDALPYPRPTNLTASISTDYGLNIEGVELGAVLVVYKGHIFPEFSNEGLSQFAYFDGTNTRILISVPFGVDVWGGALSGFSGRLFDNDGGDIISIEMADVHGYLVSPALPLEFKLDQNYPNPFNAVTRISFAISQGGPYQITIFNALGQTVETISGNAVAGYVKVLWDAHDLPSGVYFYRLETPQFTETKKAVLLK